MDSVRDERRPAIGVEERDIQCASRTAGVDAEELGGGGAAGAAEEIHLPVADRVEVGGQARAGDAET